jgi:hypothetical protein
MPEISMMVSLVSNSLSMTAAVSFIIPSQENHVRDLLNFRFSLQGRLLAAKKDTPGPTIAAKSRSYKGF